MVVSFVASALLSCGRSLSISTHEKMPSSTQWDDTAEDGEEESVEEAEEEEVSAGGRDGKGGSSVWNGHGYENDCHYIHTRSERLMCCIDTDEHTGHKVLNRGLAKSSLLALSVAIVCTDTTHCLRDHFVLFLELLSEPHGCLKIGPLLLFTFATLQLLNLVQQS
jgi:hypothetical protein